MYVWYINMAPRPPCNESKAISAVQQQTNKNDPRKIDTFRHFCAAAVWISSCEAAIKQLLAIVSYLQTTLITSACRIPSSARMALIGVSHLVALIVGIKEKSSRRNIVFFNLSASFFPNVSLPRSHLSVPKHSAWRQPLHERPVGQPCWKWHLVRAVVEQNQHRPALPHRPAAAAALLPLGLLLRQVHLLGYEATSHRLLFELSALGLQLAWNDCRVLFQCPFIRTHHHGRNVTVNMIYVKVGTFRV